MDVCLTEFAKLVPVWYDIYKDGEYYQEYCRLMDRLPQRADRTKHLGKNDLLRILRWGGDYWRFGRRFKHLNKLQDVWGKTGEAYRSEDPETAIRSLLDLKHWGLTYASKTLMFMDPWKYVALDRHIRRGLNRCLPSICDGRGKPERNSQARGYLKFLEVCRYLQDNVTAPAPLPDCNGRWRLADIQQAVFQFTKDKNCIVPNGHNPTPASSAR